jgi:hypothetical protein
VFNASDTDTLVPSSDSPMMKSSAEALLTSGNAAPLQIDLEQQRKIGEGFPSPLPISAIDRTFSTGSSGSGSGPGSAKMVEGQRQSSQGSLFEQLATQAKDLVRESTRQSSQERLLAQMDKVNLENVHKHVT